MSNFVKFSSLSYLEYISDILFLGSGILGPNIFRNATDIETSITPKIMKKSKIKQVSVEQFLNGTFDEPIFVHLSILNVF